MSSGAATRLGRAAAAGRFLATFVVPAAAALALVSILAGQQLDVRYELQLNAPRSAAPDSSLPLRALLYGELRRPEGPRLLEQPTWVGLLERSGRLLASTRLRAGYQGSLEGRLRVPSTARGPLVLRAVSLPEGRQSAGGLAAAPVNLDPPAAWPRVERPLAVVPQPPPLTPVPRAARALARFAAGPVRRLSATAQPPQVLALRVVGGSCVPEWPCQARLHVGEPAAQVRVRANASLSPAPNGAVEPAGETSGVVALRFVTHGPEAQLEIELWRGGEAVAERAFRLPVALGAGALEPLPPRLSQGQTLTPVLYGEERGCIADLFVFSQWVQSQTLPDCRGADTLKGDFSGLGPLRIQLRRDPFSTGAAAVRTLWLTPPKARPQALNALARKVLEQDPGDRLAAALVSARQPAADDLTWEYLLAALDEGLIELPQPSSGYPRALARLRSHRERLRGYALAVLVLAAVVLALRVLDRGLRASSQAGALMQAAGERPAALRRQALRRAVATLSVVTSLMLAFSAIAMYVIARNPGP